jgi:hypothetical protein
VIVFGRDICPALQLYLGGQAIDIVPCDTHLGVPLAPEQQDITDVIHDRINIGRRNFFAALSIGNRNCPMSPLTISKLYWSNVMPQMTYGIELLDLPTRAMSSLEHAHLKVQK